MSVLTSPKTLRDLMAERKVRPVDVARFVPVSITTVSAWATGRWQPGFYHRDRLRLLLAVSEAELLAALGATRDCRDGGKPNDS